MLLRRLCGGASPRLGRAVCRPRRDVPASRSRRTLWREVQWDFRKDEFFTSNQRGARCVMLNRVEDGQLMDPAMLEYLSRAVRSYSKYNEEVSSLTIRSTGSQAFIPGVDLKALYPKGVDSLDEKGIESAIKFYRGVQILAWDYAMCAYPPSIAVLDGVTGGPGLSVALNSKFACATQNTVLALTEPSVGLVPTCGSTFYYSRLPRNLGRFLALTGQPVTGPDVWNSGLATFYAPDHFFDALQDTLDMSTFRGIQTVTGHLADTLKLEEHVTKEVRDAWSLAPHVSAIDRCFGLDTVEDILAALGQEGNDFAETAIERINRASPAALKVTLRMLQNAEKLSLEECLRMEFFALQKIMDTDDYKLGVRALLEGNEGQIQWASTLSSIKRTSRFFSIPKNVDPELDLRLGVLVEDSEGGVIEDFSKPDLDRPWLKGGFSEVPEEEIWEWEPDEDEIREEDVNGEWDESLAELKNEVDEDSSESKNEVGEDSSSSKSEAGSEE